MKIQRQVRQEDQDGSETKVHMVSAGGLLESSHRIPALDYMDLMKLTMYLTKDHGELEELYRRMCFNVYAHNRDDHSRNFSYLYDEQRQAWRLSPAYDLTYSSSLNGEHATMVAGNGRDPGEKELLQVAAAFEMKRNWARETAEGIKETVRRRLNMK